MASYNYAYKVTEKMAKAVLRSEAISTKHSVEICNMLRGLPLNKAKKLLSEVVELKRAVPFKRYNDNVGHRKGMGPGRYPIKAASKMLELFNAVGANAQVKNMDVETLVIKHLCAHQASRPMRMGRQRGRVGKRTHVEVVVVENPELKTKTKNKQTKKDVKVDDKKIVDVKQEKDVKTETKKDEESQKSDLKIENASSEKDQIKEKKNEKKVEDKQKSETQKKSEVVKND
jgi:large subunit ribosomal protein L22